MDTISFGRLYIDLCSALKRTKNNNNNNNKIRKCILPLSHFLTEVIYIVHRI